MIKTNIDENRLKSCILKLKEDLIKADDELESIMDPEYLNNNMLDIQDLCSDIWGLLVSLDEECQYRFKEGLPIEGDIHHKHMRIPRKEVMERARKHWKEDKSTMEGIRLGEYKITNVWLEEQEKEIEAEKREPRRYEED